MPAYGEKQIPAGVNKTRPGKPCNTKSMVSRDRTIKTTLVIQDPVYKGNAVLNANK